MKPVGAQEERTEIQNELVSSIEGLRRSTRLLLNLYGCRTLTVGTPHKIRIHLMLLPRHLYIHDFWPLSDLQEPRMYAEGLKECIQALIKNNTLEIVPLLKKSIGSKWVFKLKLKADVRTTLATAAAFDWEIHQLDINDAFLHGYLEEDIYVERPEGFQALTSHISS
ncbi:UNVERIFIED_CONTAM: hypothetical protein Sradi_3346000 [Sesamum radiatum]|uniref:Reverse transcriptase Ty1/copia-type domain-containing protein n=1 Tax=Sesamum radiatum TaxID=300843 RepID=A0AAW2R3B5_SESRA